MGKGVIMKALRKVSPIGVAYQGSRYDHPALTPYWGATVYVKKTPGAFLEIRDLNLRFICAAPLLLFGE
jgi:hypothetical protein